MERAKAKQPFEQARGLSVNLGVKPVRAMPQAQEKVSGDESQQFIELLMRAMQGEK